MRKLIYIVFFMVFSMNAQQNKDYWLAQWEAAWTENDSLSRFNQAEELCNLGSGDRCGQNMYYSAWALSGLLDIWRVTGDVTYLDQMIDMHHIYEDKSTTITINGTDYIGWKGYQSSIDYPDGVSLWESYFYRYLATALRNMKDDATLLATAHGSPGSVTWAGTTYQDEYNHLLNFIEVNIWEKWESDSVENLYRGRTHMASHWARLGMELYEMTGTQHYLDVFNNITHDGFPATVRVSRQGKSLEGQSHYDTTNYLWYSDMDAVDTDMQDTNHANDVTQFFAEAYWLNGISDTDYFYDATHIEGLKETFLNLMYVTPLADGRDLPQYIDGSGTQDINDAGVCGWYMLSGWETEVSTFVNSELTDRTDIDPTISNARRTNMIGGLVMGLSIQEENNVYPLSAPVSAPSFSGVFRKGRLKINGEGTKIISNE